MPSNEERTAENLEQMIATSAPPVAGVLKFFRFTHLPPALAEVSRDFALIATLTAQRSSNPETTVALRKLLEAKDAAVRAMLP